MMNVIINRSRGIYAASATAMAVATVVAGCVADGGDSSPVGMAGSEGPEGEIRQAVVSQGIKDKVIAGYQGWFTAYGDGSPVERWSHWSRGTYQSNAGAPAPGYQSFELYPDVSEYPVSSLFQTGYAALGNGSPARLFSSYPAEVVNKHFAWMQQYGIDGAALQRFAGELRDGVFKAHRDSIATKMRAAAETTGRLFYVMYDISGMDEATFVQSVQSDWTNTIVGQLQLTSSSRYAVQDGRPVVSIWGLGFTDRPGTASQAAALIDWFHAQGVYVIGGVPRSWRTSNDDSKPGFESVYAKFDMISPWTVGRYRTDEEVDSHRNNYLVPDRDYCNARSIAYQPVFYPGFAWSNWNGGTRNMIPRRQGGLFWKQAVNIREAGIPAGYIAMFDEYDEGTAIAKAAEDSSMAPTNQYFLTLSSDGTYVSSDFYLRLAGKATRMIENLDPVSAQVPIPLTAGPVFFRSGAEETDATLTWNNTLEGTQGVTGAEFGTVSGEPVHAASRSFRIAGQDTQTTASYAYFKAFDVNIPIQSTTQLSFWTYPQNSLSQHITVDLIMTDGSTLRDSGATDSNGVSMHPGAARGTVNAWTQTRSRIGQWLAGKTIDRIVIAYDYGPLTGDFRGYVDDIAIANE